MKTKNRAAFVALMAAIVASSGAQAATFSLWQGGTSNLNTGWTYTSNFDGNLLFTPGADAISNATLTLNFIGASQSAYQGTSTAVTNSGTDGTGTYWQTVDTTRHYSDSLDSVNVLIGKVGGQTASGSDAANAYNATVITSSTAVMATDVQTQIHYYSYGYSCGFLGMSTCYGTGSYTTDTYNPYVAGYDHSIDQTDGYKGAFSVVAALDSTSLNLFENTGLLRYGFTVTGGGIALESATLTFDAAARQVIQVTPPAAVPVPAAAWLLGSGLLGLVGVARRRL